MCGMWGLCHSSLRCAPAVPTALLHSQNPVRTVEVGGVLYSISELLGHTGGGLLCVTQAVG